RLSLLVRLCSAKVEGDLDGAGVALLGERPEGVAPLLEPERVRQHREQVDASVARQVEVVLGAVLAAGLDLLDPEGVRADPRDLLEVQRAPLPACRAVEAGFHQRAPRPEQTDTDLCGLGLA